MTKIKRFVVLFIMLLSSTITLSSCMVTRTVMPEGFEQAVEGFDEFTVEIRSVRYIVAWNMLGIHLTLNVNEITQEDISQLTNFLTEYFRTEQFVEFAKNTQETDDVYFSISLHLFNANNENTHIIGTDSSSNFGDWGED